MVRMFVSLPPQLMLKPSFQCNNVRGELRICLGLELGAPVNRNSAGTEV